MATPNYGYEKRQRELAKKRKLEEKKLRKQSGKTSDDSVDTTHAADAPGAAVQPDNRGGDASTA